MARTYNCWKEGKPIVNIGSWLWINTVHTLEVSSTARERKVNTRIRNLINKS